MCKSHKRDNKGGGIMNINVVELDVEMRRKKMNQTTLAKKSSLDPNTISRVFNGGDCTISTACKIVKAIELTPERAGYIFFGT